jgi:hypothetical protein
VRKPEEFSFAKDEKAVPRAALEKLAASLKGKLHVYAMGWMTAREKKHPFFLTALNGNPHVVYFRERGGDPLGDAESFNVMLAVAEDRKDDLLFFGGDFNNQPFTALGRVK